MTDARSQWGSSGEHSARDGFDTIPAVSIVMAEYNTPAQYLDAAIESILHQDFDDFELVLVDDGSANDVEAIVDAYRDPRIRLLHNPENIGLIRSLERGIASARSELIARMDTDDIYAPDHLKRLVELAAGKPDFAVYASRSIEFSDDEVTSVIGAPGEKLARDIIRGDVPAHPATLLRKQVLAEVGGYPNYPRAEDFALWCEVLLGGHRILVGDAITHRYRVELGDYSKRRLKNRWGEIRARLHYYPLLNARPWEYAKILRSAAGGLLPPALIRGLRRRGLERAGPADPVP